MPKSLNSFAPLRTMLVNARRAYYVRLWGMDLHPTCQFSLSAHFDKTYPRGVHVAEHSYIAFDAAILTHDRTRGLYLNTYVGPRCFVGARSIILPGVTIGEGCVVGAGSVVTKDVPAGSLVAGNPARVLRDDLKVGRYGRYRSATATERRLRDSGAWS